MKPLSTYFIAMILGFQAFASAALLVLTTSKCFASTPPETRLVARADTPNFYLVATSAGIGNLQPVRIGSNSVSTILSGSGAPLKFYFDGGESIPIFRHRVSYRPSLMPNYL